MPNFICHDGIQSCSAIQIANMLKFSIMAGVTSNPRTSRTDGAIVNHVGK